ncbi:DsbA family protein [Patulibacter defluvii]|uniref:DsbA family protein n=1 Tax=Patulibacter defluvii TaxID=3095358 RepID=UPI002A7667F3|nr:DsbA family protein [Patulibacter sp. DM4]
MSDAGDSGLEVRHHGRVGDDHGGGASGDGMPDPEGPPAFYFDFRDPWSYLAAERVIATLPVATPWVPIDAGRLAGPHAWEGFRCEEDERAARDRIARTAVERGLQPLRWPLELPFDSSLALRAAWYAKGLGRVVSFSLPAFRQAYAGGHDLATEAFVLISASAAEMHPRAVGQALRRPPVIEALEQATTRAIERGVRTTPAVWTGDRVFHGDDGVDEAARHLAG